MSQWWELLCSSEGDHGWKRPRPADLSAGHQEAPGRPACLPAQRAVKSEGIELALAGGGDF